MSVKLLGVGEHGWRKGGLNKRVAINPNFLSTSFRLHLMSHPQVAVVHLSTHRGKWLKPALPAMLVYSADLQVDRKDDRTGLFWADP